MTIPSFAEDATPQYPSGVDSITAAIAGTVSATQQNIDLGRSADRLKAIRTEFTRALAGGFSATAKIKIALANKELLCNARVANAILAAQRSYASAVTAQLQQTATPGNITTLLDAIGVIFHHYSIDIAYNNPKTNDDVRKEVLKTCAADANAFGNAYYGADAFPQPPLGADQPAHNMALLASEPAPPGADIAIVSAFSALIDAINAIVNPIAKAADIAARQQAILAFLQTWPTRLTTVSTNLAQAAVDLANRRKLQAAGQFSELLASISSQEIDLSTIDGCKQIVATDKPFGEPVDDPNTPGKKIPLPSARFQACYFAIWQSVNDRVSGALKAADDYDQFADASNAKVVDSARKIKDNIKNLGNDPPDLKSLWEDALKLVAFGKMLQDAFSQAHQDAVKTAIQNLVKAI